MNIRKAWLHAAALATTATVLAACGGGSSDVAGGGDQSDGAETTLTLVAYAVPEPGWSKIIPAFAATEEGKGVAVTTSYGASGDQSRAVVDAIATTSTDRSDRPLTDVVIQRVELAD